MVENSMAKDKKDFSPVRQLNPEDVALPAGTCTSQTLA